MIAIERTFFPGGMFEKSKTKENKGNDQIETIGLEWKSLADNHSENELLFGTI